MRLSHVARPKENNATRRSSHSLSHATVVRQTTRQNNASRSVVACRTSLWETRHATNREALSCTGVMRGRPRAHRTRERCLAGLEIPVRPHTIFAVLTTTWKERPNPRGHNFCVESEGANQNSRRVATFKLRVAPGVLVN